MPYILEAHREALRPRSDRPAENSGEVHFQIASLINDYLNSKELNYENINSAIGVLACAQLELYRRVSFYEIEKQKQNGDVFDF